MLTYYVYRRVTFETTTALHAGSGEHDPLQDMPIQLDCNGFPVINASSVAGVLRHLYPGSAAEVSSLFGDLKTGGSRLVVSDALPLDGHGVAIEGLRPDLDTTAPNYLKTLRRLFYRDHCAHNHRGTALTNAKFDRSILIAGVRFILEFRVGADTADHDRADAEADRLVSLFDHPEFRLGGGTRNGFGAIRPIAVSGRAYDLTSPADRQALLNRSASLAVPTGEPSLPRPIPTAAEGVSTQTLNLKPELFWLCANGTGDGDIDIAPKFETRVDWSAGVPSIQENCVILPATSVKGALRHRTAYHYNRLNRIFADQLASDADVNAAATHNPAVEALFGFANDTDTAGQRGRILLSDIYFKLGDSVSDKAAEVNAKILNHVAIDRFTGGSFQGALFTEKVIQGGHVKLDVTIMPPADGKPEDPTIRQAFDAALDDLRHGRLPLGGGVNRGLGAMTEDN